jgi:hypothetical protein
MVQSWEADVPEIRLADGAVTLVDEAAFNALSHWRWRRHRGGYAWRLERAPGGKRVAVMMHRAVMQAPDGLEVDHINGDTLDNRRANLRLCTKAENRRYRRKLTVTSTSPYKGVSFRPRSSLVSKLLPWIARIGGARRRELGRYATAEEAARAYDAAAVDQWGAFARRNFPDTTEAA